MMGLPSCRQVTLALSKENDQPAQRRRSISVRIHLMVCAGCRGYARQFDRLGRVLQRLQNVDSPVRLTDAARTRIAERLRRDDAAQP